MKISLERIMDDPIELYHRRKGRDTNFENLKSGLDYLKIAKNALDKFEKDNPDYIKEGLLNEPQYHKELGDLLYDETAYQAMKSRLNRRTGSDKFADSLTEKDIPIAVKGERMPSKRFFIEIVKKYKNELNVENLRGEMENYDTNPQLGGRKYELPHQATAHIRGKETLESVFKYALTDDALKKVDMDIATGMSKHAIKALEKVHENIVEQKNRDGPIDSEKIKLGLDYVKRQDYYIRDSHLPKKGKADDYQLDKAA